MKMTFFRQCALLVGALIALMLLQGAQSMWMVNKLGASSIEIASSGSLGARARSLWDEFRSVDQEMKQALGLTDVEAAAGLRQSIFAGSERIRTMLKQMSADDATGAAGDLERTFEQWHALAAPHLSQAPVLQLASYDELDRVRESLSSGIDRYAALKSEAAGTAVATIQSGVSTAMTWVAISLLLALVASAVLGIYAMRRLRGELGGDPRAVADLVNQIASGDLSSEIRPQPGDSGSILAGMARMQSAIKTLVAAQVRMKQEHDAGSISYRLDSSELNGSYREMADGVNELVDTHIAINRRVVEVVSEYAKGNLSEDIEDLPGERAKITEAIVAVKHSLQSVNGELGKLVASAAKGDFSQRGDAGRFEHDFREMVEGLNRLMESADTGLGAVASALNRVAQGDLTVRVEGDLRGQFAQLQADANKTVEQLAFVIGKIRESSDTINLASKEIAQGNSDLSQRTEQQASSLQQTAQSMEELTATVNQNTQSARQANQLAAGASEVAMKGGDVVRQVVNTMGGITESSKKIADIISVIDGIAFQTNILALNAAVEAARAGEQGRGFAVVATEVRNLAQRSANSAKEIKALITDSVSTVEAGSRLVNEAGTTMEEIVNSVRRVTDIMSEITAASQEQSGGIEQVNRVVTQMDQVTQQNAALVEQAAAAAESMQEQAEGLAQAVAIFRLAGGSRAPTAAKERRSAQRATNVERLPQAKVRTSPASRPAPRPKAVGADDEWQEF